jgi:hypothetical protein
MSARAASGGGLQRLSRLLFNSSSQSSSPLSFASSATTTAKAGTTLMMRQLGLSTTTTISSSSSSATMTMRRLATAATTASPKQPAAGGGSGKSQFDRWWGALRSAPPTALALGAFGVVPFIALSPPVSKHIAWLLPFAVSERAELFQVGYGVAIASFLGGVHWGAALSSPLTAGPVAARMAAERFAWGVVPSLLAWPLVAMEAGPASALLSALLPALYLVDRRFARRGLLPVWYMALRAPLTLGATFGCLLTASYHAHLEADRVVARAAAEEDGKAGGAEKKK